MKVKKIIPVLMCVFMSVQTAAADDMRCIFKNSGLNETKQLVSGDIYVYAPKKLIDESTEINILPTPQIKMMKNDGSGEAETSGTATTAEKAVDGDVSTMARAKEYAWNLELDLTEETELDNIAVTFASRVWTPHYRVEIASENAEWITVAETSENTSGGKHTVNFEKTGVRYIRITNLSEEKNMGICEVESIFVTSDIKGILAAGLYNKELNHAYVFETMEIRRDTTAEDARLIINVDEELTGLPNEIPEQENLLKKAAGKFLSNKNDAELVASGTGENAKSAENAFDGNKSTYAKAGGEWAYTFEADMGELKNVTKIKIYFNDENYPIDYDVLVSVDGSDWKKVGGETENDVGGQRIFTFETAEIRYIRIRDNVAQTNIRQMGIAELEAYEHDYTGDFEIRAFLIEDEENKTPLYNDVFILTNRDTEPAEITANYTQNAATINSKGQITLSWEPQSEDKPLLIWVEKDGDTVYANMMSESEYRIGTITLNPDNIDDGNVFTVKYTGAAEFSAELIYDKQALQFDEMMDIAAETKETEVIDVVKDYINSDTAKKFDGLSEEERTAIASVILNGEFDNFEELETLINAEYDKILENRKKSEQNKNSSSTSSSGGSSGGSGNKTTASVSSVISVPQPENTYKYEEPQAEFNDLDTVEWAKESINTLYKKGIINGTSKETFSPETAVTRAEFVKMLVSAFDVEDENAVCNFDDVNKDDWYYSYVASAYATGAVNGISEDCFGAEEKITRQDAAVMLYRFMKAYGRVSGNGATAEFADNSEISDYAVEAVGYMSANSIMNGVGDNKFEPNGTCTRAMAAKIICAAVYGEGV